MNFCKVEVGQLFWIYPWNRLLPLPNFDRTTLLHQANLYWVPEAAEVVQLAPYPPPPYFSQARPRSSSQPPLLTVSTYKPPLSPFKRSKCPSGLLLLLRMPLFGTLSKSTTTSFMGCLLLRHNIFRTIGLV